MENCRKQLKGKQLKCGLLNSVFLLRSVLVCLREGGHSVDMVPPMTFRQSDSSDSWDRFWSLELNPTAPNKSRPNSVFSTHLFEISFGMMRGNDNDMYKIICIAYQNVPNIDSKWYHVRMLTFTLRQISNNVNSTAHREDHPAPEKEIPSKVLQEYSSVLVVSPPSWIEKCTNQRISVG